MKVEFYRHNLGQAELERLAGVLETVFLTTGPETAELERRFARYLGVPHAVAVSSCTAAMHLALEALGVGPGDEVITTPMTYVATTLAILHTGARPVWVDVEPATGNLRADLIEPALTPRTRAILPVHLYGQMCDMRAIRAVADRHGLRVIEDAAHALESARDGVRVGELADASCYSFYATKSITSGEGGAVATRSEALARRISLLRAHGVDRDAAQRYGQRYRHWDLAEVGWKYNLCDVQAALLIPQLERVEALREARAALYRRYAEALAGCPGLGMPRVLPASRHGYHLFTVWVDPAVRDETIARLQQAGIGVTVNYRSINLLTRLLELFGKGRGSFPASERIGDSTLSLPFYPRLTEEELEYVAATLRQVLGDLCGPRAARAAKESDM